MYVTRDCLTRIGLMDERYFLYFEDLDWGIRAKHQGKIGYADDSIVLHDGGTTIGSAMTRQQQSPLAIYLDFRNRLLFVRSHGARWLAWLGRFDFLVCLVRGVFSERLRGAPKRMAIRGQFSCCGRICPGQMIRHHNPMVWSFDWRCLPEMQNWRESCGYKL